MNVLITGVTSFIGKALASELISQGYEVWGTVRKESNNKDGLPEKLQVIELDMDEMEYLSKRSGDLKEVYACFHLAWGGTGRSGRMDKNIQDKNVSDTLALIKELKFLNCQRLIFSGSQAEYGVVYDNASLSTVPKEKIREDANTFPVSEYGKAKLRVLKEAGKLCRELGISYIHLRIFSVYGKGDHDATLISSCVKAFKQGEHISLSPCSQMWNYLHVKDAARYLAALMNAIIVSDDESEAAIVNVASEYSFQLREYVSRIRDVVGQGDYDFNRDFNPEEGIPYLNPDTGKLKELTKIKEEISFEDGIKECLGES